MSGVIFRRIGGRIIPIKSELKTIANTKVFTNSVKQAKNLMNAAKQDFNIAEPYYHGTKSAFKKFDVRKVKSASGAAAQGYGINLAKNPATASAYAAHAGGNVHKVFVRNGKFFTEYNKPIPREHIEKLIKMAPDKVGLSNFAENEHEALRAALHAYKDMNPVDQVSVISNDFYRGNHKRMGKALKSLGYTGIDNKELGIKVVFNADDVRSVFHKFRGKK